ncbi:MAG: polyphosphate kinase 1 [Tissierellia bacterium]|nr:polyphosphate kinase 1 [Tissierellia bacterium]
MEDLDISFTQNRELSWLKFNERVLEEAQDTNVPLLERMKFFSIFDSNYDEFFMVRVGSLTDLAMLKGKAVDNKSLMDPDQQLDAVMEESRRLFQKKDHIYEELKDEFKTHGYSFASYEELSESERHLVKRYFESIVMPILSFQIVDLVHPFPHIPNLAVGVLCTLRSKKGEIKKGYVQVPERLNRYLEVAGRKIILLEEVIKAMSPQIFDNYEVEETYTISVTRNADIDFDDEELVELAEDYRSHMKKLLKKRKRLQPVRLEIDREPSKEVKSFLLGHLGLKENRIFVVRSPFRLGYIFSLIESFPEDFQKAHTDKPFSPQVPAMVDPQKPVMGQALKKDLLLSYPYESMDPIIRLLREAAEAPEVVSVKITLYRIAKDSQIARELIRAAENGKEVVVLMELRARFDEENNIIWSSRLEEAGCRVIYGHKNFKCHSKVLLITRMTDQQEVNYITQVATGNYNEKTAKLYTDFSFITADMAIGQDAVKLFDDFLKGKINGSYKELMVSPQSMQEGLDKLIDQEIAKGKEGYIRLKMNSISDRILIDRLSEASNAGVKIDMMVRGICCIIPGIKERTENLRVFSVVGRFLEHHRIYQFGRGEEAKIYISSADFMTRNIRKRVEVACPIYAQEVRDKILHYLDTMFADDVKIRQLQPNKEYTKLENKNNLIGQEELMKDAIKKAQAQKKPKEDKKKEAKAEKNLQEKKPEPKGLWQRIMAFFGRA